MKLDYTFIKALAIAKKKGGGGGGSSPKVILDTILEKTYAVNVSKGGALGVEICKLDGLKVGVPARITIKGLATKTLAQAGTGTVGLSEKPRQVTIPVVTYDTTRFEMDAEMLFTPTAETMYINLHGINSGTTTGYSFCVYKDTKIKVEQWS